MGAAVATSADRAGCAIVLAGGLATRFPGKLAAVEGGLTLLERAVRAVGDVAERVVVVLAPDGPEPTLSLPVTFVRDEVPGEGPLAGLASGLSATASDETVLVVGGDMPDLVPDVLTMLARSVDDSHPIAALGEGPDDRPRPLPVAVLSGRVREAADSLIASGERRLRALLEVLPTAVVGSEDWLACDPGSRSLRDVDVPGDLRTAGPGLG